ncbi:MAG: flagellar hook-basal body complex protein FliE [Pseudomonadota bacterium]
MDPIKGAFNHTAAIPEGIPGRAKSGGSGGTDFSETLKSLIGHVDQQIREADLKAEELALGKRQDLHEVMIAGQKADLSFRFLLQVRNKLLDAYQEVMRMQF